MLRYLQVVLLFIGATVLASVWGSIAIALFGAATFLRGRSGEGWGSGLGFMYAGLFCGMPLGALSGFAIALQIAKDGMEEWRKIVWIAVTFGAALGSVLGFFAMGRSHVQLDLLHVLSAAVAASLMGTTGGMAAVIGEGLWRRAGARRIEPAARAFRQVLAFVPTVFALVIALLISGSRLTLLQGSLSILIAVPVLAGSVLWLKSDGEPEKRKKAVHRKHTYHSDRSRKDRDPVALSF